MWVFPTADNGVAIRHSHVHLYLCDYLTDAQCATSLTQDSSALRCVSLFFILIFFVPFALATAGGAAVGAHHGHHSAAGARKPKLRRFNSHDTSSNMFSVADFENARLARRNEIELNQRRARRVRGSANNSTYGLGSGSGLLGGAHSGYCDALNGSGDYSTGDSKASKGSSEVRLNYTIPIYTQIYVKPISNSNII